MQMPLAQYFCKRSRSRFRLKKCEPEPGSLFFGIIANSLSLCMRFRDRILIMYVFITVLPTVADHKVTHGMGCQIWKENLVVKWFFNFSNIHLVGPFFKKQQIFKKMLFLRSESLYNNGFGIFGAFRYIGTGVRKVWILCDG